jgi:hypothetical protein
MGAALLVGKGLRHSVFLARAYRKNRPLNTPSSIPPGCALLCVKAAHVAPMSSRAL